MSLEEDAEEGGLALDKDPDEKIVYMALHTRIIQDTLDTRVLRVSMVWTSGADMYGSVSGVSVVG